MSVYHCPLCPLIFQYRTEVEWHLREEHRSRADEAADMRAELAAATRPLDWNRLGQLRSSRAGPSVTLLLSTAPAATMTVLDVARLRQLAERARRRLSTEPHRESAVSVVEDRLSKAVSAAESQATDRGMAVLVNKDDLAIITLPLAPRDRQVVDRGFATRDLDYALRRYPRCRVLVLGHHPRILEGHALRVSEPATLSTAGGPRNDPPSDATVSPDSDTLLSERVDTTGTLPLVVVGDQRDLDRFRRGSRYASDVIGEVRRSWFHRANVADLVAETLDRVHHAQQARAVAELLHADTQSQIAWGIHAAWNAVHSGTADRLWVEHDYHVPGRRTTSGVHGIETTADSTEPGAVDDLVDALLAKAARVGIETHLLDRHSIGAIEPVAVKMPVQVSVQSPTPPATGLDMTVTMRSVPSSPPPEIIDPPRNSATARRAPEVVRPG